MPWFFHVYVFLLLLEMGFINSRKSIQMGSNFSVQFGIQPTEKRNEKKRITNKESACGLVSIWGERVRDQIYDSFKNDFVNTLIRFARRRCYCKCYFHFDQITRRIQIQLIKILYKWMSEGGVGRTDRISWHFIEIYTRVEFIYLTKYMVSFFELVDWGFFPSRLFRSTACANCESRGRKPVRV